MTEAQLSTALMIGLFLLAPAIIILLGLAGWLLARVGGNSPAGRAIGRTAAIGGVAGVSLFIGTMIATAGGAIYPPILDVAVPYACEAPGPADIVSTPYSYRPGQRGVTRQVVCPMTDGTGEDRTLRAVLAACLIYGLAIFGFFMLLIALRAGRRLLRGRSA